MMMTDQIPLDLPPPLLNGEVAMMPHMINVNGDGSQQEVGAQISRAGTGRWEIRLTLHHQGCEETRGSCDMAGLLFHIYRHVCTLNNLCTDNMMVILVQVNPGETFTIRAEDGSLQCIQANRNHDWCVIGFGADVNR
ncbi:hypothetical protein PO909_030846 [Leuciscus waleckii]